MRQKRKGRIAGEATFNRREGVGCGTQKEMLIFDRTIYSSFIETG